MAFSVISHFILYDDDDFFYLSLSLYLVSAA